MFGQRQLNDMTNESEDYVELSRNHDDRDHTARGVLAVGEHRDHAAPEMTDPNPALGDWVALAIVALILVIATMFGGVPPESTTSEEPVVLGPACSVIRGEPTVCQ